jgi:UDP-glucuronate 4-epimerase
MHLEYQSALVTGAAGFIGFHLSKRLLEEGYRVYGVDNLNDYYDLRLKQDRLAILKAYPAFSFHRTDIAHADDLDAIFRDNTIEVVVNLAAQAGVRYSLTNPQAYVDSNLVGFVNVLECCRHHGVKHLVFASSSSVYGANTNMPFSVHNNVDHPVSLYAASKKSNELMAHTYSHLFKICLHRAALFYGIWPVGAAGHGPVPFHQGDSGRQTHRRFQPR